MRDRKERMGAVRDRSRTLTQSTFGPSLPALAHPPRSIWRPCHLRVPPRVVRRCGAGRAWVSTSAPASLEEHTCSVRYTQHLDPDAQAAVHEEAVLF